MTRTRVTRANPSPNGTEPTMETPGSHARARGVAHHRGVGAARAVGQRADRAVAPPATALDPGRPTPAGREIKMR